jgi:23S rRNA pseudouridine2605 synthase
MIMIRLNKILSNGGVCSRRDADKLIAQGNVRVNGALVTDLGAKISQDDKIEVNGKIIDTDLKERLWIYYKPIGLLTTNKDPLNRPTIFENLKNLPRVISIGRLDLNSEGLLLLTNNGDLARKFELPSSRITRIYKVRAYGDPAKLLKHFARNVNVTIDGVVYNVDKIAMQPAPRDSNSKISGNCWINISLMEGKNREIRKIFEYFDMQVNRLIRTNYGPFSLSNLNPGEYLEVDYTLR